MSFNMLSGVQFPAEARDFTFLTNEHTSFGNRLASYSVGWDVALRRDDGRRYVKLTNDFYVLLNVHPNTMIVFFTDLNHKFFILTHLLNSSTCFEHYYAHLQEDNCISTTSGIVSVFG